MKLMWSNPMNCTPAEVATLNEVTKAFSNAVPAKLNPSTKPLLSRVNPLGTVPEEGIVMDAVAVPPDTKVAVKVTEALVGVR